MIEHVVSEEKAKEMYLVEMKMLDKYKEALAPYAPIFSRAGCEMKVGLERRNDLRGIWSDDPLPLQNGYVCQVYCMITKDGEVAQSKSDDGEVDYYLMFATWGISRVDRRLFKLKIWYNEELDDEMYDDMQELISLLKNIE